MFNSSKFNPADTSHHEAITSTEPLSGNIATVIKLIQYKPAVYSRLLSQETLFQIIELLNSGIPLLSQLLVIYLLNGLLKHNPALYSNITQRIQLQEIVLSWLQLHKEVFACMGDAGKKFTIKLFHLFSNKSLLLNYIITNLAKKTRHPVYSNDALIFKSTLGDGTYGSVTKALIRNSTQEVAIKKMLLNINKECAFKKSIRSFSREIKIHSKLQHKNIIAFFGVYVDKPEGSFGFILEIAEYTLKHLIDNNKKQLTQELINKFAFEIAQGLSYIHAKGMIYCDLKSSNILIKQNEIKLADFNIARFHDEEQAFVGTMNYMAPEVLLEIQGCSIASDIYSLAIVFWELAHRKIRPWKTYDINHAARIERRGLEWHRKKLFKEMKRPEIQDDIPREIVDIIKESWKTKPQHRMPLSVILDKLSALKNNDLASKNNILSSPNTASSSRATTPYSQMITAFFSTSVAKLLSRTPKSTSNKSSR